MNKGTHTQEYFEPNIRDHTMQELERVAGGNGIGTQRRLCLIALARDSETLRRLKTEEPEAFSDMEKAVFGFREHAEALLEVANAACVRIELISDNDEKQRH
ncbi:MULTISPECIES: hypothetical protein [Gammaproteobacteria]|uniref:Uncharacterized protein n=1 Tax=Alloalcanivorax xenomutans TaxID=1094342 RepID=A0A9Q3ZHG5_9GAMM|nr:MULTISPECIES: hypothetical protein [Gammaproteobacteria]ARB47201.1 hypothetical protein P40_18820 [Alloalcanivorax xenomutans]MCE7510929.1 hypothetical protein [Alloalcanivorax xenomutans]HIO99716.1 hypothetical protein [Marinobacter salarius]